MSKILKKTFISFLSILMMISMSPINVFAEDISGTLAQSMVDLTCKSSVTEKEIQTYHGDNETSGIFSSNVFQNSEEGLKVILPFSSGIYLSSNGTNDEIGDGDCDSDLMGLITKNNSSFGNDASGKGSATWLSFKTVAKGKALSFNYVFASNEFNQTEKFNDTFGLFVTNITKAEREKNSLYGGDLSKAKKGNTVNIATFTDENEATAEITINSLLSQSSFAKTNGKTSYLQTLNEDKDDVVAYEPGNYEEDGYKVNPSYGQTQQMQALYEKSAVDYQNGDELEIKFAIANCGGDNEKSSYVFIQAHSLGFDLPNVSINYEAKTISNFGKGTYQITESNDDNYLFTFTNTNKEDNVISFAGKDDNGKSYDFEGDQIKIAEYNTETKEASNDESAIQIVHINEVGISPTQLDVNDIEVENKGTSKTIKFAGVAGDEYMVLPEYYTFKNDTDYENLWNLNGVKCTTTGQKLTFNKFISRKGKDNAFVDEDATTNFVVYSRNSAVSGDDPKPASAYTKSDYLINFQLPSNVSKTNATDIDKDGKLTLTSKNVYKLYSDNSWIQGTAGANSLPVGKYNVRNQYRDDNDTLIIGATDTYTIVSSIPTSKLSAVSATAKSTDAESYYGVVYGVTSNMEYSIDGGATWDAVTNATGTDVKYESANNALKVKATDSSAQKVYFRYATIANEDNVNNLPTNAYSVGVEQGKVRYNLQLIDNVYSINNGDKVIYSTTLLDTDKAYTTDVNIISFKDGDTQLPGYFYTYDEDDYSNDGTSTNKWQIKYDISAYQYQYIGKTTVTLGSGDSDVKVWLQKGEGESAQTLELSNVTLTNNSLNNKANDYTIKVQVGELPLEIFVAGKLDIIDNSGDVITTRDPEASGDNNAAIVFGDALLDAARNGKLQYSVTTGNNVKPADESTYKDTSIDEDTELKVNGGHWYAIRYKATTKSADSTEIKDAASEPIYVYVREYKEIDDTLKAVKTDATDSEHPLVGFITGLNPETMELATSDQFYSDEMVDISSISNGKLDGLASYSYYYVRYKETTEATASKAIKLEIPRMVVDFNPNLKIVYSDDEDTAPTVSGLLPYQRSYSDITGKYKLLQAGMEYYESVEAIEPSTIKDTDWVQVTTNQAVQLKDTTGYLYVRQRAFDRDGEKPGEEGYFIDTYASNVKVYQIANGLSNIDVENVTYDSTKSITENTSGKITNVKAGMVYRTHGSGSWIDVTAADETNGYVNVAVGSYDIAYKDDVAVLNKVVNYKTVSVKYAAPEAVAEAPLNGETYGYLFNVNGVYIESKDDYKKDKDNWKLVTTINLNENGALRNYKPGNYVLSYSKSDTEAEVQNITIPSTEIYTNMAKKDSGYEKGVYLVSTTEIDEDYLASGTKATITLPENVSYVYYDTSWPADFVATGKFIYSFDNVTYANKDVKVYYKNSVERPSTASNADNSDTTVSADDVVVKFKSTKEDDTNTYTLMDNGSYSISSTDNLVNIGDPYASNIVSDDVDLVIGNARAFSVTVNACETKLEAVKPTGISYKAPTKENNGKITGVTSEMEYVSKSTYDDADDKDSVEWTTCNSTEVKVDSGYWYVRYKTRDNYKEATEDKFETVFVPYFTGIHHYEINVNSPVSVHKGAGYSVNVESVTLYWRSSSQKADVDKSETISITDAQNRGLEFNDLYYESNAISQNKTLTFALTNDEGETVATKNVTIQCIDHTAGKAVKENNVDPTCTANGSYDSVVYCTYCGKQISRTKVTVAALGHSYVTDYGYAATGASTGLTNGSHCSRCGYVNVAQQTIGIIPNAVGYTYTTGTTECRIITNTDASRTVAYKNKQNKTKYQTIPGTVNLNGQTFTVTALKRDCVNGTYVKTLTLASSITNWEYGAFNGDNRLTKINVTSSTLNVENGAFAKMKVSARRKLKVYVTKRMSKKAFNTLKAQLVSQGLKASNIKRM